MQRVQEAMVDWNKMKSLLATLNTLEPRNDYSADETNEEEQEIQVSPWMFHGHVTCGQNCEHCANERMRQAAVRQQREILERINQGHGIL
jgi:hypothetical protein